jgi:hypothetical protein
MQEKAALLKLSNYLRIAGVVIVLAAFPLDKGSLYLIGFIVMGLGGALRFAAART